MSLDGGEVADLVSGFDGGTAEGDEVVALAGAGRSDDTEVVGAADPVQGDEVVVAGRRDRGLGEVELGERLDDGEAGRGHPGATVRFVAGGDLDVDEHPQCLFWCPALCLGGEQHVGCLTADRRQLEPFESGFDVAGQRGGGGARAHARSSTR